jgi:alkylation response protein AidB-like acyl-CoA dehydrogenase
MTAYESVWNSPERKALRDSVAALTRKEIVPHLPQWEEDGMLPRELHATVAKAGFLGLGFPEEVGGSGGDMVDVTVATEAMLEAGGSGGVQASDRVASKPACSPTASHCRTSSRTAPRTSSTGSCARHWLAR